MPSISQIVQKNYMLCQHSNIPCDVQYLRENGAPQSHRNLYHSEEIAVNALYLSVIWTFTLKEPLNLCLSQHLREWTIQCWLSDKSTAPSCKHRRNYLLCNPVTGSWYSPWNCAKLAHPCCLTSSWHKWEWQES